MGDQRTPHRGYVLGVGVQLVLMLMLELCAEFVFGGGPGAGPGYGDRGRGCRRAPQLVKDGRGQAAGSAREESQDQGGGFLQGLPRVEPCSVLITEFDHVGELHQFLESATCFGMGSKQGRPDVGIVGDDALAAEFLEHGSDAVGAR